MKIDDSQSGRLRLRAIDASVGMAFLLMLDVYFIWIYVITGQPTPMSWTMTAICLAGTLLWYVVQRDWEVVLDAHRGQVTVAASQVGRTQRTETRELADLLRAEQDDLGSSAGRAMLVFRDEQLTPGGVLNGGNRRKFVNAVNHFLEQQRGDTQN
ncbi:hypothetical protein Q4485_01560 [Granulosicoccaceae sp. 1_MG-2023]|nr:hypothetical protein [Granulosicoccaceae sp. 1_MG-2023]